MVEMTGIAETYHFSQLERVHPEHGGAEVVTQPHAFKSSVIQRLILHQGVRAGQVSCDVRPKPVQVACLVVAERPAEVIEGKHIPFYTYSYSSSESQLAYG